MTRPARPLAAATTATAAALLASGVLVAAPAAALACTGQVRYAPTTNTLYLNSGTVDLPQLKDICAAAPLRLDDAATGTWQLRANLVVRSGATLRIRGAAAGGTVNVLRLMSQADGKRANVVEITAQHGELELHSTAVTSWDDAANGGAGGPDLDPSVPASAGQGGKGRAFIRAVSYMDGQTPRQSRMDITDSDVGHLGFYAAEAYGVAYKARGCGLDTPEVCEALDVFGSQRGSRFHHNYMGTYTWGALGMVFDGNEYDHNVMYGLDPHDDSDDLTITGNHSHHNGAHGIICSQRCNGLLIADNEVDHNGIPPYTPPGSQGPGDGQIHGIMLHRGVTDTVVTDNFVHDHPNGAGIAVFDSSDDEVHDNVLRDNKFGLRVSVGSQDLDFSGNTVTGSGLHAVYAYPGVGDSATYGVESGRPTDVAFSGNTFEGSGSNVVRLVSTDDFRFNRNTVRGAVGAVRADASTDLLWQGSKLPGDGVMLRKASRAQLEPLGKFKTSLDAGSVLDVVAPDGGLSEVTPEAANPPTAEVTESGSVVRLHGGPGVVIRTVTPRNVQLVPASGQVSARIAGWASTRRLVVSGGTVNATTRYRTGNLTPGMSYAVRVDGVLLTTRTAAAGGTIVWTYLERTGGSHEVTIAPTT